MYVSLVVLEFPGGKCVIAVQTYTIKTQSITYDSTRSLEMRAITSWIGILMPLCFEQLWFQELGMWQEIVKDNYSADSADEKVNLGSARARLRSRALNNDPLIQWGLAPR